MAPEYAMKGMFSIKSDVFSFGVLILEIVSGQRTNSFRQIDGPLTLIEHVSRIKHNSGLCPILT